MKKFLRQWRRAIGLALACAVLTVLWLPGVRIPITSDTTMYALLGENFWHHGTYMFGGLPFAKQLPLHAIVSYPLCWLFNFQLGMKLSGLFAGCAVLIATYFLIARRFSRDVAFLTVIFLLLHHGFVLMTMLGSADLLFTALFLGSIAAFDRASENRRMYLLAGLLLGLASLTRYNGVLLYALYPAFVYWKRPKDFRSLIFWVGMTLALALFGLWLLRNALAFGSPFHTAYTSEFAQEVPSLVREILRNISYYVNPLHNILPVLFLFSLYGLIRFGRKNPLLVLAMVAGSAMAILWWVQGIRFAFPGYPILLGFSAAGADDLWTRFRRLRTFLTLTIIGMVFLHASALCVYAYGSCNAWLDRTIALVPTDLHISSEGLYAVSLARDYIDEYAASGAAVLVRSTNALTWRQGVFRSDLRIIEHLKEACPSYEIEQGNRPANVVFVTSAMPRTYVTLWECPAPPGSVR